MMSSSILIRLPPSSFPPLVAYPSASPPMSRCRIATAGPDASDYPPLPRRNPLVVDVDDVAAGD